MTFIMSRNDFVFFDAGMFIGALLRDDPRYGEARPLVEAGRRGDLAVCTTTGILSEVYAALTWIKAQPRHSPMEAADAIRLLLEPPSAIEVLSDGFDASIKMLELSAKHGLTARRIHDARHAATALASGITEVYTYDVEDWSVFKPDGIIIVGPGSSLLRMA